MAAGDTRDSDVTSLEARLAELSELGCWEWQLRSFDGDRLCLIGGGDMVYSYDSIAWFSGVTWISCPTRMMHARFRAAAEHEAARARLQAEVERGATIVAIDSQTTSSLDAVSFIVARAVEIQRGLFRFGPLPSPPAGAAT